MNKYIIIPAYNESKTIYNVITDIVRTYGDSYNIVVVDDASTDSTGSEARRAGAVVLRHVINRYQGAALVTGTEYALRQGADIIIHIDADGQHDTSNISRLSNPIERGEVDVVLGSRFIDKEESADNKSLLFLLVNLLKAGEFKITRRLLLSMGLLVNTLITRVVLTDAHNGLRALSRYAAKSIDITQDGMAHNTEYVQEIKSRKLTFKEVPVLVHYGVTEKKSQGFFHGIKILQELLVGKFIR